MERQDVANYIEHFGSDHKAELSPGIRLLQEEHAPLLDEAEALLGETDRAAKTATPDMQECEKLLDRFVRFTDCLEQHSEKEERVLFGLLKDLLGTPHGPIEIMELEHEEIRKHLQAFAQIGQELTAASAKDELSQMLNELQQANEVMQQHFYKEEHAIFPMAEQLLSAADKERILDELS